MPGFEGRSVRTQLPDRSAPGAGDRRLLLIEGIPGSGKTTAARRIAEQLAARGIPARWHLEESRSHPVAPRDLRRTAREPGFGPRLLDSWRRFAASAPEGEVTILEGTLFQSGVRFLYANDAPVSEIRAFVEGLVPVLSPLEPLLMLLRPAEPLRHQSDFVFPTRGARWVEKVSRYTAETPVGRRNQWIGRRGMAHFWCDYWARCMDLARSLPWPRLDVSVREGDWDRGESRWRAWVEEQWRLRPAAPIGRSRVAR